jgi:ATP-binding cassette subfamily B protein
VTIFLILITHRLSMAVHAQRIYVFADGRIVEERSHTALLSKCGLYGALWRQQTQTQAIFARESVTYGSEPV